MSNIEGSALIAQSIQREGINTLFGLAGGPIAEILGYAPHYGVRPIGVRHEQAAVFAAAAYGYVKNQAGVAVLAGGPAASNGVTGAHVAYDNCFPIVIIGGSGSQRGRYTGMFQETESVLLYKSITKMSVQVDSAARIPEYLSMAFRRARSGRPGPVYLDLPSDVLHDIVDEGSVVWPHNYYTDSPPLGHPDQVKRAADLLKNARRPMMIVGKGVRWSEPTRELRDIIELLGMPYLTSPMGRGYIPDDHPLNFNSARSDLMRSADVVLVVGARMNWMFDFGRRFAPEAQLIQIDISQDEIGSNRGVSVGIVGDAKCVLRQLLVELAPSTADRGRSNVEEEWVATLKERVNSNRATLEPLLNSDDQPVRTYRLFKEIREVFPPGTIYSVDGQITLAVGRQVLPSFTPASRLNSGTNGCMGVGVPFAIGAKLARPEVPVVSISGDSAFGFNAMEMETAVRHRVPIVFVVSNNSGIVGSSLQKIMGLPEGYQEGVATFVPGIRYDKILDAFGGHPEHVESPEEIRAALKRAYHSTQHGQVACVNVITEPVETTMASRDWASALMGY
ncbi:MAG TPA: thiamine pyrophosphate-binding protein [Dehalococcoidia bacterium]|nr:thiamine pyrophosphate-binding protein [Dehalococcoidia bacterium]